MTTYRVRLKGSPYNGGEYEEHPVFKRHCVPGLFTWVCLQIGEKQWRWFADSVLEAVKSPFDSGMVYCYPMPAQNFDSGLLYDQPQPLTVVLSPEMAAHVNASANVVIVVRKPAPVISLYSEALRAA